jgi:hypothetical protein
VLRLSKLNKLKKLKKKVLINNNIMTSASILPNLSVNRLNVNRLNAVAINSSENKTDDVLFYFLVSALFENSTFDLNNYTLTVDFYKGNHKSFYFSDRPDKTATNFENDKAVASILNLYNTIIYPLSSFNSPPNLNIIFEKDNNKLGYILTLINVKLDGTKLILEFEPFSEGQGLRFGPTQSYNDTTTTLFFDRIRARSSVATNSRRQTRLQRAADGVETANEFLNVLDAAGNVLSRGPEILNSVATAITDTFNWFASFFKF